MDPHPDCRCAGDHCDGRLDAMARHSYDCEGCWRAANRCLELDAELASAQTALAELRSRVQSAVALLEHVNPECCGALDCDTDREWRDHPSRWCDACLARVAVQALLGESRTGLGVPNMAAHVAAVGAVERELADVLRQRLAPFVGEPNTPETRAAIVAAIGELAAAALADEGECEP